MCIPYIIIYKIISTKITPFSDHKLFNPAPYKSCTRNHVIAKREGERQLQSHTITARASLYVLPISICLAAAGDAKHSHNARARAANNRVFTN